MVRLFIHLAWSTISAVNGAPCLGVTWNVNPHGPTITSAGAARAYTPGCVSVNWYSWVGISISRWLNNRRHVSAAHGLSPLE